MNTPACLVLFVALLSTSAAAQSVMYITYDGALVYDDADYLADIVDTLTIGDTVMLVERHKRFALVTFSGRRGWVLLANIGSRAPKVKRARDSAAALSDSAAVQRVAPAGRRDPARTRARDSSAAPAATCAGTTKSGRQCSRKAMATSAYCWQHGSR